MPWGHDACTVGQSYRTLHTTYVHVRLYVMNEEPFIWETQPAQKGVVIRNASTEDMCNNAEEKLREYRSSVHKLPALSP